MSEDQAWKIILFFYPNRSEKKNFPYFSRLRMKPEYVSTLAFESAENNTRKL